MASLMFRDPEITCENVTEYRSLRRGDQIAVEGLMAGVDYYHHGIFLGHEKGVADFGGAKKTDAKVRTIDLLHFTDYGKRRLVRVIYPKGGCLDPEKAAENAEKLVKNPRGWGQFDLMRNNCEHFATWCKTGVKVSQQVIEKLRKAITNPIAAIRYAVASSSVGSSR